MGGAIALIDMGLILKNHTLFTRTMADLKADMERAQAVMQKESDALKAFREKVATYTAGSPEFQEGEKEFAERYAGFNVRIQLQKKDFQQAQAKILYREYQEIQREVDAYAQANGIAAVFKFMSQQPDPAKPDEMMNEMQVNPVIWFNRNLDITRVIVDSLNRRAGQVGERQQYGNPVNLPPR